MPTRARLRRHLARQARRLGRRLDRRSAGASRRRAARAAARRRRPAVVPARRLVRRRGRSRVELLLLDLGRGGRGAAGGDEAARRDHRLRPEPDRPGDRVRLLLRPRGADLQAARLRGGDGQLQPGDRLHRLRHLRPALLRAALARGGARGARPRAAGRRRDAVRRPDAAAPRALDRGRRATRSWGPRTRRSTSPRTASASARSRASSASAARRGRRSRGKSRRSPRLPRSATRCWCGLRTCSAAGRCASATTRRRSARRWERSRERCWSTASSRTRSRSTSTRSVTARTFTSPPSCSTSRRPASTRATRRACFRRSRSRSRMRSRSSTSCRRLGPALGVVGLLNVQLAVADSTVYVLEANPRASRTVPFASKATGVNLVEIACRLAAGEKLARSRLDDAAPTEVSVKAAVLPFARFPAPTPCSAPRCAPRAR